MVEASVIVAALHPSTLKLKSEKLETKVSNVAVILSVKDVLTINADKLTVTVRVEESKEIPAGRVILLDYAKE